MRPHFWDRLFSAIGDPLPLPLSLPPPPDTHLVVQGEGEDEEEGDYKRSITDVPNYAHDSGIHSSSDESTVFNENVSDDLSGLNSGLSRDRQPLLA